MTPRISREWAAAAVACFVAFLVLTAWVKFHGPIPGDEEASRWGIEHPVPRVEVLSLYQFFGGLGSPIVAALVTLTAAIVALRNLGSVAAAFVIAGAAIVVIERPIAAVVGRTDAAKATSLPGGGYPSGHVLFVTGLCGILAWHGARHRRPEVTWVAVAVAVLMGITRVAGRAHLIDEVLAGYLLAGTWLCVLFGAQSGQGRV